MAANCALSDTAAEAGFRRDSAGSGATLAENT